MNNLEDRSAQVPEHPSRLAVNIYLLVGIAILLLSSLIETGTLARYLIGTLVEFLLAGLALLAMRIEGLAAVRTARLKWPPAEYILLAVAAAPGLWITGVLLNLLAMLVLGYTTPVPPSQFPSTVLEALALALATLVAAPLCEELMFRGYVQRAYERRHVWVGAVTGGLVFALYHLRFQGVAAITPVALALSVIAWRTGSIVPGIALHAAYNAIATVLLVTTSFLPMQVTGALTGTLLCAGILLTPVSFAALFLLWRRAQPAPHHPISQPRRWLRWAWVVPLVGLAGVYGYAAVTEVLVGRFPDVVFNDSLELSTPPDDWDKPAEWRYTIENQLGDELGATTCRRQPEGPYYTLTCESDHEGYDLTDRMPFLEGWGPASLSDLDSQPNPPWWPVGLPSLQSLVRADPQSWTLAASWAPSDLTVQEVTALVETPDTGQTMLTYKRTTDSTGLKVTTSGGENDVAMPSAHVLMPFEWAWRLSALPFEVAYGADASIVTLDVDNNVHIYDAFINVRGGEPVWTPAGMFVAWKVIVFWKDEAGHEYTQTAWYRAESPHTLVRFHDGTVNYVLTPSETIGQ